MSRRWSFVGAVILGAALVAVPAGAATLITGKDIKNGTVTSADVKDGSLKEQDLAAVLRNAPATTYGTPATTAPAFASTQALSGTSSYSITITRPGKVLLLAPSSAGVSATSITNFVLSAALFVDKKAVKGSAVSSPSFDNCITFPPVTPCPTASGGINLNGLVIGSLSAGTHTLQLRASLGGVSSLTLNGTIPQVTVVELG